MKKYIIVERQACIVEWRYPVEAANEGEALRKYSAGDHGECIGPEIGDSLDFVTCDLDVEVEEEPT